MLAWIIIVVGILFLLVNVGILPSVTWGLIWPIIIILIGISMLRRRHWWHHRNWYYTDGEYRNDTKEK